MEDTNYFNYAVAAILIAFLCVGVGILWQKMFGKSKVSPSVQVGLGATWRLEADIPVNGTKPMSNWEFIKKKPEVAFDPHNREHLLAFQMLLSGGRQHSWLRFSFKPSEHDNVFEMMKVEYAKIHLELQLAIPHSHQHPSLHVLTRDRREPMTPLKVN